MEPRSADFSALEMTPVPRLMQAVTSFRAPRQGGGWPGVRDWAREEQVEWWRTKRLPPWWRGLRSKSILSRGEPAPLTALGRRLVGVDDWG